MNTFAKNTSCANKIETFLLQIHAEFKSEERIEIARSFQKLRKK